METPLENNSDQQQNEAIQKWGSMVQRKLRANAGRFTQGKKSGFILKKNGLSEGKLSESIKAKYGRSFGAIDFVSFSFERHGVFVQKGVGRGSGVSRGFVLKNASDARQEASGRMRQPHDWFNSEIEQNLPELADKLAEINADLVLDSTKMMIK